MAFGGTIHTKLSPDELLRRMHGIVGQIYKLYNEHMQVSDLNKAGVEAKISFKKNQLKTMLAKFEDADLKQIYDDAKRLGQLAKAKPELIPQIKQNLEQIENLLGEIRNSEKRDMRNARFLGRVANHLSREVRGTEKEIKKARDKIMQHMKSLRRAPLKK